MTKVLFQLEQVVVDRMRANPNKRYYLLGVLFCPKQYYWYAGKGGNGDEVLLLPSCDGVPFRLARSCQDEFQGLCWRSGGPEAASSRCKGHCAGSTPPSSLIFLITGG